MELPEKQNQIKLLFLTSMALLAIALLVTLGLSFSNLNPTKNVIILSETAEIKSSPSKNAKTIQELHQGDMLQVSNQKQHWYKVKTDKKQTGWLKTTQTNFGEPMPGTKQNAVISEKKVPLTLKPNNESNVIQTLKKGSKVIVTAELTGWTQITYNKVQGWVPSTSLKKHGKKDGEAALENKVYTRQKGTAIRKEPKQTSDTLSVAPYGEKLIFLSQVDDWYQVLTDDKKVGYVPNWVATFSKPSKTDPYQISPLADKTIVLDPGHGGKDKGATSNNGEVKEATLTLATANYIKKALEETGAKVLLTRTDDSEPKMPNKKKGAKFDLVISLHYDSSGTDDGATGTTVYYHHASDQVLAQAVNTELAQVLTIPNRGIEAGTAEDAPDGESSSLRLDLGYMNNDSDVREFITKTYQEDLAKSLTKGLMTYYEIR
ncbi:SH3 domain-containing protein [Vagococcus coleopterorum]|uniref:SH3 domain-containing protein n=1 Tax=Vagococcus coleopterorum TaxID=2714946 RepID=A0A6G8AMF0_9ENTE|nr:N-acetylmuramoyl-L-alanine amidase [Vagococcus coleopterorum]QIL46103.1 SH3 domain-containing protein [Vagococcus coleopterorum]